MFFSDPKLSVELMYFFLVIAAIPVGLIYWKTKQVLVTVTVASFLAQFIVRDNVDYQVAYAYDKLWVFWFTKDIWPYINLALVIITISVFVFRKFRSVLQD